MVFDKLKERMVKRSYILIFALVVYLFKSGWCAEENIIRTKHETIVGRSKDYKPVSSEPGTLIFTLDPASAKIADKDAISKLCSSAEEVQGVLLNKKNGTIILSIKQYGGSVEAVAEKLKGALREKLGIRVIESRVIN
jgi:hypothetical protein